MKVLVYGAGQLARMMYLAGTPLGIDVQAVDVNSQAVVNPISKEPLNTTLEQAILAAESLTAEFEHVPEALLQQAHDSGKLRPGMQAILTGADRVREKALLEKLHIANSAHRIVTDIQQLDDVLSAIGADLIIKASRDGYDGYGQWRLRSQDELAELKLQLADLDLQAVPLVAEKRVEFEREVSLIGVRDTSGNVKFYPLAENLHHQGQLHVSVAPATDVTEALQRQAEDIFTSLANELDYVGVLAVEMFQVGSSLLVNEIAPRVHNSGHWTMQGSVTCQFENHLRAVTGLPLGDTRAIGPSAMINIIGCTSFSRQLLSIPGCHLHWYGKSVRKKRKMGHINVVGQTHKELGEALQKLAEFLPLEHFPKLISEAKRLQAIVLDN
ncbi:5-(carboxyamino)imidazole ribonucleotide synthase [Aestuariibacter salexigens]|uniref:5-(carboxyamino)imidazole ribonucleotide synthase n=1 Tax=Aestuariibacter salexigens TaxID=226010 RepID=UPI0004146AC9|nr:5-(carboxyamino)imidazole ribonucleotide synthase [Aestuariibacter salexigens]